MGLVIISNEELKAELLEGGQEAVDGLQWVKDPQEVPAGVGLLLDLLFENQPGRIEALRQTGATTIIIHSVTHTLAQISHDWVRINGWPGFLSGKLIEAAGPEEKRKEVEAFFSLLGKKTEWLPDQPGFVTARVISMIINEAFFALSEGVSSREEIDTAMKLGTNYPYGPFEWAERIGLEKVHALLATLSKTNSRYQPAPGIAGN